MASLAFIFQYASVSSHPRLHNTSTICREVLQPVRNQPGFSEWEPSADELHDLDLLAEYDLETYGAHLIYKLREIEGF